MTDPTASATLQDSRKITRRQSSIMRQSLDALQKVLPAYGYPDANVVLVQNTFFLRKLAMEQQTVKVPAFALIPQAFDDSVESFNAFALQRQGIKITSGTTDPIVTKLYLKPVTVTLRTLFLCQTAEELFTFVQTWKTNAREMNFNLVLNGTLRIKFKLETEAGLQAPDQQLDQIGEWYQLETTIRLHSYIGELGDVSSVRKQQVNAFETPQGQGPTDPLVPPENAPELFTLEMTLPQSTATTG